MSPHLPYMNISVGTAQLSFDYGITETSTNTEEEALDLLCHIKDQNICHLDTAPSYGNAEKIIGRFHDNVPSSFKVTTKVDATNLSYDHHDYLRIKSKVKSSLSHLSLQRVDGLLCHSPEF